MENFKADYPCTACGLEGDGYVCYHHLHTQKAHSEQSVESWNLIPVCLKHHNEFHNRGAIHMSEKYRNVNKWLLDNGWYRLKLNENDISESWMHDS